MGNFSFEERARCRPAWLASGSSDHERTSRSTLARAGRCLLALGSSCGSRAPILERRSSGGRPRLGPRSLWARHRSELGWMPRRVRMRGDSWQQIEKREGLFVGEVEPHLAAR